MKALLLNHVVMVAFALGFVCGQIVVLAAIVGTATLMGQ